MIKQNSTVTVDLNAPQCQFTLLCDYADIIVNKRIITEIEGRYFLYAVVPPYPSFEEYSKGDEFEEGDLLAVKETWGEAHKAQTSPL